MDFENIFGQYGTCLETLSDFFGFDIQYKVEDKLNFVWTEGENCLVYYQDEDECVQTLHLGDHILDEKDGYVLVQSLDYGPPKYHIFKTENKSLDIPLKPAIL